MRLFNRVKGAAPRPPGFYSGWIGIESATDDIQQITPIAQRNSQQLGEVLKHHSIAAELFAKGQVFQQLGDGANPVHGGVVEDIEGRMGVDKQGGDGAVVAREGHVSIHCQYSVGGLSHHSFVAKRMGGGRTQVGEPATEKTGRPEGLPRTAAITCTALRVQKHLHRSGMLLRSVVRSPNLNRHMGDGPDYKPAPKPTQGSKVLAQSQGLMSSPPLPTHWR